jgi:hypothetical protein
MQSEIVANFIFCIHLLFILFIILTPLLLGKYLLILIIHVLTIITMIIHWVFNSDACSLTLIESYFRNIPDTSTFCWRLVSPVYKISESDLSIVVWVITLFSLGLSIYIILNRENDKIK